MGILDRGVDLEEFNRFKADVLGRLDRLNQAIEAKITDSEEAAAISLKNTLASEVGAKSAQVRAQEVVVGLETSVTAGNAALTEIKAANSSVQEIVRMADAAYGNVREVAVELAALRETAAANCTEINQHFSSIKAALVEAEKLPSQVEVVKKHFDLSTTIMAEIEGLKSHALKRKSDIDDLHRKILGVDVKSADGELEHVDGLVDELQASYQDVEAKISKLGSDAAELLSTIADGYNKKLKDENERFVKLLLDSKNRFDAVDDQLKGLLPGAMAAGLSAAYEDKKDDEAIALTKHEGSFKIAICLMVLVSLIPFVVDAYQVVIKGSELLQVLRSTPNLMVSVLPLYFPVLWFAYSSSKKLNLSKRLIEEYTHKAVLGKTFSGLSNQIESLPRESLVRDELRTKLLFNLLQVSSENPGKLITDYNKSDHPLMDALENSAKLADSIGALSKLPGFSALASKLAARADVLVNENAKKVASGLDSQSELEKKSDGVLEPINDNKAAV